MLVHEYNNCNLNFVAYFFKSLLLTWTLHCGFQIVYKIFNFTQLLCIWNNTLLVTKLFHNDLLKLIFKAQLIYWFWKFRKTFINTVQLFCWIVLCGLIHNCSRLTYCMNKRIWLIMITLHYIINLRLIMILHYSNIMYYIVYKH